MGVPSVRRRLQRSSIIVSVAIALTFSALPAVAANSRVVLPTHLNSLSTIPADISLRSIWCASSTQCVAVGGDGVSSANLVTIVGDPATWGAPQARAFSLGAQFGSRAGVASLSCSAITACVAVGIDGNDQPLVLAGNPTTWSVGQASELTLGNSSFGGGGYLSAVSCASSSACAAVGVDFDDQPITLAGNPASWALANVHEVTLSAGYGTGGVLVAISCPVVTYCVAGGSDNNNRILSLIGDPSTWDVSDARQLVLGSSFSAVDAINAISCVSTKACVAAGTAIGTTSDEPFTMSGYPTAWGASDAVPISLGTGFGSGGTFNSINCVTTTWCTAVGTDSLQSPLTLSGNPATWTASSASEFAVPSTLGAGAILNSVSCAAQSVCASVGGDMRGEPVSVLGDPASWSLVQTREIPLNGASWGASASVYSLTCVSTSSCVGVGTVQNSLKEPFLIVGNPSTWSTASAQQTPLSLATGFGGGFNGVSCASAHLCTAVGWDLAGYPLVAVGDPSNWSAAKVHQVTLSAAFGGGGSLSGVRCTSATSCVAVGTDDQIRPITISGNPATWSNAQVRLINLPSVLGTYGELNSVSCTAATSCVAVGDDDRDQPLVLRGNPATWTAAQAHQIAMPVTFGSAGSLSAVTCTSATTCVAVGLSGKVHPLVLVGNPATWTVSQVHTVNVVGASTSTVSGFSSGLASSGRFSSVACSSSTTCLIVGGDGKGAPIYTNGSTATLSTHAALRPTSTSAFTVAEFAASACVATKCYVAGRGANGVFIAAA